MCGIAGIVGPPGSAVGREALLAMARTLAHRGPDGSGAELPLPHVGLAHRRLAIIDLVSGGQPMSGSDRKVWITFNGEIFNYRELREELAARGRAFRTRSDTEVLLALYEQDGVPGLARLRGQYAFAIWDGRSGAGKLVVARDPLGIKPLYWSLADGLFLFASEPRAILAHPRAPRGIDAFGIHLYLRYRFIPSPRTAWSSMRKLRPGEVLELDEGRIRASRARSFAPGDVEVDDDGRSAAAALGGALERAVERQRVADVPVGAFLSGGLDSSTIATLLARHTEGRLSTFTIGFRDADLDERRFAELVATRIGSEQVAQEMDARAAVEVMPRILDHLDEPFGDPSLVPTWLLCSLAARHGKVAMSGDGGDELFGGYGRTYRALGILEWPRWLRPMQRALRRIRRERQDPSLWVGDDPRVDAEYVRLLADVSPADARSLYGPRLADELRGEAAGDGGDPVVEAVRRHAALPPFSRLLAAELETKLADYHLVKVDRASMAHGLEVRVPFLDQDLVDLAFRWTPRVRLSGGRTKGLLRDAMAGTLPAEVLAREKKGFGPPLATWFREGLGATVRAELLDGAAVSGGWLRRQELARLTDPRRRSPAGSRIWRLWVLERWLSRTVSGPDP